MGTRPSGFKAVRLSVPRRCVSGWLSGQRKNENSAVIRFESGAYQFNRTGCYATAP